MSTHSENVFKWCKSELVHFDYAGLSNQVIAERRDPYIFMGDGPHRGLVGDRYVSTYTYGPLGLIMRTAEMSDADPTNNRNHYYLSDVMGGNIGQYVDDDGDPDTLVRESVLAPTIRPGLSAPIRRHPDRAADLSLRGGSGVDGAARGSPRGLKPAAHGQFDAFGNDMTKPLSSTSSFAWRGREGSVTDRASGLVYMQARHYDPSIGRFIQADALPLPSLTTQGMNRYIYCQNDPVNKSDPSGLSWAGLFVLAVILIVLAFLVAQVIKWFILNVRVCNMPRARVNINSRTLGPIDELRLALEGFDESLPAGTSLNPLPTPAKDAPSAIADLINFLLGLF